MTKYIDLTKNNLYSNKKKKKKKKFSKKATLILNEIALFLLGRFGGKVAAPYGHPIL
jgi:hypothetical protein